GYHLMCGTIFRYGTIGLDGRIRFTHDRDYLHAGSSIVFDPTTPGTKYGSAATGWLLRSRLSGYRMVLSGTDVRTLYPIPSWYAGATGLAAVGNFPCLVVCRGIFLLPSTARHSCRRRR